jgi:hypothetical protein
MPFHPHVSLHLRALVTVSPTDVVCCKGPLMPVIVKVKVPMLLAAFDGRSFRVLVVVAGFGIKVALLPDGAPLTLKETRPAKPSIGVIVTA